MEGLIEAIKSNDLVAARKLFAEAMAARTIDLIKEEKIAIARNFLIEGEEPEDEEVEILSAEKELADMDGQFSSDMISDEDLNDTMQVHGGDDDEDLNLDSDAADIDFDDDVDLGDDALDDGMDDDDL